MGQTCRLLFVLLAGQLYGQTFSLRVSNETVPAGGSAQIKVFSAKPRLIASGRIVMTLDAAVFGAISNVAVFSAEGDALGIASVSGQSLDVNFQSPAGGIGQLPMLPILTVTVPVLTAATGTVSAITVDASQSSWTDVKGAVYPVSVTPGSVTVGGTLSIQSVTPGGGLLQAGSLVRISGTAFSAATIVDIPQVSVSNMEFVDTGEIELTLGAAADLTGRKVTLTNPDGSRVEYFSSMPSAPDQAPSNFAFIQPLIPMQTWTSASTSFPERGGGIALQNPNATPVNVILQTVSPVSVLADQTTVTVPAGALYVYYTNAPGATSGDGFRAFASRPLRMIGMGFQLAGPNFPNVTPEPMQPALAPIEQIGATPAQVSFQWQIGAAAPAPVAVSLQATPSSASFKFTVTGPGAPFSAALSQPLTNRTLPATLAVSVNPAGLSPGAYSGSIVLTPEGPNGSITTIPLSLTVDNSALLTASPAKLTFAGPDNSSQLVNVTSNGNPVLFTATAAGAAAGWLAVSPSSGTTPAQLTVTANSNNLSQRSYSGQIVITGPNNSLTVPVQETVDGADIFVFAPTAVTFSVRSGSGPPAAQTVLVYGPSTGAAFSASASSGVNWLGVSKTASGQLGAVVTANPAGLAAGTYNGTITLTSPASPMPAQFPVTLAIWNNEPVLNVSPASVTFTTPLPRNTLAGASPPPMQSLQVTSGAVPLNFTLSTQGGTFATPASIPVYPENPAKLGAFEYNITILGGSQTVVVPVTTVVSTDALAPPYIASIVNAASQIPGAVAPGEILTIYGFGAGPSQTAGFMLDSSGNAAASLKRAQVLFDGRPAPMIYGSPAQANVIVPYEVAGRAVTTVALEYGGVTSQAWAIPVAASAPGIFTLGADGIGQGAVLNQDNSANGASNTARRGSVIQIYATGEGQTSPPGVTGSVIGGDLKSPVLPVSVTVGGLNAPVQYAGSAGNSVAGLLQINALVPMAIAPGTAAPIVVSVGGKPSQRGVTVAVQ